MTKVSTRTKRIGRHQRIRATVFGTAEKPRVAVFKSNRNIFVQFVDDNAKKTLFSNKTKSVKLKGTKTEKAEQIGEALAKIANEKGIKEIVFDRGGFKYHGRVKAVAEGLRKGGLKF